MADDSTHPWEQQEGESNRWYQRFTAFRLMGPGRTLSRVFNSEKALTGLNESKYPPGNWKTSAERWHWRSRAEAWDRHIAEEANTAMEERWKAQIMGKTEVLGRLSEQGRINIGEFITEKTVLVPGETDEEGKIIYSETQTFELNMDAIKKYGHLVKKVQMTRYGPSIELHDGQAALVHMGRHLQLFTDNVDVTSAGKPLQNTENLDDEQIKNAIGRLSQIGMAIAGGQELHAAVGSIPNEDTAG